MANFVSSGAIYLGAQSGVSTNRSVGIVRGYSNGSTVTMNDATVRSFAARYQSGSTISMNDFYGRAYFDGSGPGKGDDPDMPFPI